MLRPTSPRTATLFRVYYGLLAVSLVLSSVLIGRHAADSRAGPGEIVIPAPRDPTVSRNLAPTINWGGRKR